MGIELGLQRIKALLNHTPLPWRALHVAGTNGKGSVCNYMSRMLRVAGVRTGQFTTPHIMDRWDSIAIGNQTVSESDFKLTEAKILELNRKENIQATEFEILTAIAFNLFTQHQIEVGVVEVGMGGRLDATNVLANPLANLITRIGLDHQAFLGNTVVEIAREKAGICKPGVPVLISDDNNAKIRNTIWEVAKEVGAVPMAVVEHTRTDFDPDAKPEFVLTKTMNDYLVRDWAIPKMQDLRIPRYRRNNMHLAYVGVQCALEQLGRPVTREMSNKMVEVMHCLSLRGRHTKLNIKELTGRHGKAYMDGAHNPQAAKILDDVVKVNFRGKSQKRSVVWVLAFSHTKNVSEMLQILLKPGDMVVCCEFGSVDGMPWAEAFPSKKLARIVKEEFKMRKVVDCGTDVLAALKEGSRMAESSAKSHNGTPFEGPLIITGSLYLTSDVYKLLRAHKVGVEAAASDGEQSSAGEQSDGEEVPETEESDTAEDSEGGKGRIR